jgi:hypothetical protein
MKDAALEVKIENEKLIISIGISTLANAAISGPYFTEVVNDHDGDEDCIKIDASVFAQSILAALNNEEEDGTTLIDKMLDSAAEWVFEQGYEGIEIRD